MSTLLPLNENQMQRDIETVGSNTLNKFDTSKLTINPLYCDVSVLEHLAFSLDVSIESLTESEARVYLQNAREIKKYIGSPYAVKKAASSIFGNDIKVQTWDKHNGVPGTYKILLDANEKPLTQNNINKAVKLIDQAKRKSAHLSAITINMKNSGMYKQSITSMSSEVVSIVPRKIEDMNLSLKQIKAVTVYMIETASIKPRGV